MRNIDDTSWKSLSGVRANKYILHLVPNIEVRCSQSFIFLVKENNQIHKQLDNYLYDPKDVKYLDFC